MAKIHKMQLYIVDYNDLYLDSIAEEIAEDICDVVDVMLISFEGETRGVEWHDEIDLNFKGVTKETCEAYFRDLDAGININALEVKAIDYILLLQLLANKSTKGRYELMLKLTKELLAALNKLLKYEQKEDKNMNNNTDPEVLVPEVEVDEVAEITEAIPEVEAAAE